MEPQGAHKLVALENAEALFGGPQGLLRSAAAAVAIPWTGHQGGDPADPTEQEIRALARFGHGAGLILDASMVEHLIAGSEFVGKGMEHVVVVPKGMNRVPKDYDPRVFDAETFKKPIRMMFTSLSQEGERGSMR